MKLTIDNDDRDIIYADKVNYTNVSNDNIMRFNATDCTALDVYLAVVCGASSTTAVERQVLAVIIKYELEDIKDVVNKSSEVTNKSPITIKRAINELRTKHLVYVNEQKVFVSKTIAPTPSLRTTRSLVIDII